MQDKQAREFQALPDPLFKQNGVLSKKLVVLLVSVLRVLVCAFLREWSPKCPLNVFIEEDESKVPNITQDTTSSRRHWPPQKARGGDYVQFDANRGSAARLCRNTTPFMQNQFYFLEVLSSTSTNHRNTLNHEMSVLRLWLYWQVPPRVTTLGRLTVEIQNQILEISFLCATTKEKEKWQMCRGFNFHFLRAEKTKATERPDNTDADMSGNMSGEQSLRPQRVVSSCDKEFCRCNVL